MLYPTKVHHIFGNTIKDTKIINCYSIWIHSTWRWFRRPDWLGKLSEYIYFHSYGVNYLRQSQRTLNRVLGKDYLDIWDTKEFCARVDGYPKSW